MKTVFCVCLVALSVPFLSFANHNTAWDVNRRSLDKDPVLELLIPVLFGVTLNDIESDFGDPRGDGTRTHEGQDIFAPKGTPIVSPTEAIVIRSGDGASSGKYVYTANPGGETFRYMHLDTVADLDPGDRLDVGDYIGTVGDTGNAPAGVYHLHFEVRDEDNDPLDPYTRLTGAFTMREKMTHVRRVFSDIRRDDEYADFLVSTFTDEFVDAINKNIDLPPVIDEALKRKGVLSQQSALEELTKLIQQLPKALTTELNIGDQNGAVTLLQLYLIYTTNGDARDRLATAGATGYFGPTTAAALKAYQIEHVLGAELGVYDMRTREALLKRNAITLRL